MKKLAAAFVISIGLTAPQAAHAVTTTPHHQASTVVAKSSEKRAGCVSKREFRRVKKGWAKKRVHRVFGTAGTQSFVMGGYESRDYKPCRSPYGFVSVDYHNGKLDSKTAYWG